MVQSNVRATRVRKRNAVREVYFVRAARSGLIKIGVSNDTGQRLTALQNASGEALSLVGIIVSDRAEALEEHLHNLFSSDRERGEWFRPSDALKAFLACHPLPRDFAWFQHNRNQKLADGSMSPEQVVRSLLRHPQAPASNGKVTVSDASLSARYGAVGL